MGKSQWNEKLLPIAKMEVERIVKSVAMYF